MRVIGQMKRSPRLAAIIAFAVIAAPSICAAAEPAVMTRANQKWREARCTLRIELPLKKGTNREGWSRSPLFTVGLAQIQTAFGVRKTSTTAKGERMFYYALEVSDRDALAPILAGESIPPGTRFIAEGWSLARPEKQEGVYLQLRFEALPQVKARLRFLPPGKFGSTRVDVSFVTFDFFPLSQFETVERYSRIEAFQLQAADEQLTVPAPTQLPIRAQEGAPVARTPSAEPAPFKPAVRLLAVSCQPAQLRAGDEVEIVLNYAVEGIPAGASFEVVERREILRDEEALGTFEKPLGRMAGTFTSTLRVRIPETAPPALYSVRGTVTMAGSTSTATALLEVIGQ